ncbi:MAG: LysE family translocator [Actinomycetota bacterium]|nr:LysE family translocator [Actinomycetota bacterium]
MPDATTYGLFVAAALLLLIVPGPAVLYVVARSVEGGRLAGLVSVLGVELGTLVHVAFATVGLSAIVASSATAFGVVKWLGVAYLVWLGLQRLLSREAGGEAPATEREGRLARVFAQSVLVQVLNPKVALFFLAFLPQFIDPSRGAAWAQVMVLGATLVLLGLLTDGLYAVLGGTVAGWLRRRSPSFHSGERYVSGGVYLALGAAAAASGSGKH